MTNNVRDSLTRHGTVSLVIFACLALAAASVTAQVIDEIIVTAQKREQSVQDVPVSISTFAGEFIEDSGIDTLQQLGQYTPNLSLAYSSQVANNRVIMRGVGSVGNSAIEPSVAVFVDGVYIPRPSSIVGTLTDLEIVEVLRGPQGTLFGRNASMGALNIRTRKPTEELSGNLRASYGNYDHVRVSGGLSGAFSPEASGRLAFQYSDRNGYGENSFTEGDSRSDVGEWDDFSLRGKLYFTPHEDLDITLTADYARVDNGGGVIEVLPDTILPQYLTTLNAYLSHTDPFSMPNGEVPETANGFDYKVHQDHQDDAQDEQWGISGDINWRIGGHTVRSITGYRDWSNDTLNESIIRLPSDLIRRVTYYEAQTVSQELQLLSPTGGRIEYVAGVYYYQEDYDIDQRFDQGPDFCKPFLSNQFALDTHAFGVAEEIAIDVVADNLELEGVPAQFAPLLSEALITGAIHSPEQLVAFGVPAAFAEVLIAAASPATVFEVARGIGDEVGNFCDGGGARNAVSTRFQQDVSNIALYGQFTFKLTEQLRITGGVRWTDSDKDGSFTSGVNNPIGAPPSPENPYGIDLRIPEDHPGLKFDEEEVTWMANISFYPVEEIMLYATYATGFRSGGFNSEGFDSIALALGATRSFDTETVDNVEAGAKGGFFNNQVLVSLNYFHTEIDDLQDRKFDGVNFLMQNVEKLTQQGMELDIQARPLDQFYAVLGVSYLDSEFGSFPDATGLPASIADFRQAVAVSRATGAPLPEPPARDLSGQRNHFSPKWQLSLVGEWTDRIPATEMSWFLRGEYQYTAAQNVGADTNQGLQSIQRGYDVVNARLGLRSLNTGWELSTFVRNAFDEGYCQVIFIQALATSAGLVDPATGGGMHRCVLGAPRTWGVEAAYRF
ncbi:MAG: TonB-dependent receptor [Gammaproteobacteria bacterium]|nr:TonB-dependent receptor [Gammaproteobacteria bacterium]